LHEADRAFGARKQRRFGFVGGFVCEVAFANPARRLMPIVGRL